MLWLYTVCYKLHDMLYSVHARHTKTERTLRAHYTSICSTRLYYIEYIILY